MEDLSGKIVRSYELRQLLGHGGFGAVYRAYQPLVRRDVAIKIILPEYANQPNFIRRFEAEAQLVARLEHLHIVPLYDYWREPDGAYLIMRWLRGASLHDSIKKQGTWTLDAAARMIEQIAAALAVAHRSGVVHRDMKPANILLDEDNNAYLTDFGIAINLTEPEAEQDTLVGSFAYMSPEQIKKSPVSPQTDIYGLGIVLFETLTGQRPFSNGTYSQIIRHHLNTPLPAIREYRPELPAEVDEVIQRATAKDPLDRYSDTLAMAAALRHALTVTSGAAPAQFSPLEFDGTVSASDQPGDFLEIAWADPTNPYKGLRAFEEADAADFFGREHLIQRLLARLGDEGGWSRFLAVVGPSGSGKSSVVRAGILPALRQSALPGSERWFVASMMPGANPLDRLASALVGVSAEPVDDLGDIVRADQRGLVNAVRRVLPDGAQLVLFIDQFEELFTHVTEDAERTQVMALIRAAADEPESPVRVIVTLRADFYDRPLLYTAFGDLIRERTEVVLPLSPDELERAVVGPAERMGVYVDTQLIAAIVADVRQEPGALPLLQYALTEVFERRDGRRLTFEAYRQSGGVLEALARRAEALYLSMDDQAQQLTRQVFLRLITPGEGTEDTRRRARLAELLSVAPSANRLQAIFDLYGSHRLLTFDNDADTREPTIEVAHEALIRRWARLRDWLDESREILHLQRRLSASAEEWAAHGRDASFLANGVRLQQFEALLQGSVVLTALETEFTRASAARRDAASAEEALRQQREAALERQSRQRLRGLVTLFAVATLVAVLLSLLAFDQRTAAQTSAAAATVAQGAALENAATAIAERDRADEQANQSRSREFAVRSLASLDENQTALALLFSLEAYHVAQTDEARSSLLAAVENTPYLTAMMHGHSDRVRAVAFSPDGSLLASISRDQTVRLWDAATHQPAAVLVINAPGAPWSLAVGDGLLAIGDDTGTISLWNPATGEEMGDTLQGHVGVVYSLALSPDGQTLASGGEDHTIRLWDVSSGAHIGEPLSGHTGEVVSLAFRPDGRYLASGSADTTVRLWDIAERAPVGEPVKRDDGWVYSVAFSPDGATLASGSGYNTVTLWHVDTAASLLEQVGAFDDHQREVRSVAFSADGRILASASADGTIMLHDVVSSTPVGEPLRVHEGEVSSVTFSADGHTFASGSTDQVVILWDLRAVPPGYVIAQLDAEVRDVAYSPDGQWVAAAYGDGTVRLWDSRTSTPDGDPLDVPGVTSLAISHDSRLIALGLEDSRILLWDHETRAFSDVPLEGHVGMVLSLAFSPTDLTLASASQDSTVRLWDVTNAQPIGSPLEGHRGDVMTVAFNLNGNMLASGGVDGTIIVWNISNGAQQGAFAPHHTDQITSVAFSPDGQMLASGSFDESIMLWDVETGQPIGEPLRRHNDWVNDIAFSPASADAAHPSMLASAAVDGTIILWDVDSAQPIARPLMGHDGREQNIAFSPDGSMLVSGGTDGRVIVWAANPDAWVQTACQLVNRTFTALEQAQFEVNADPCREAVETQ